MWLVLHLGSEVLITLASSIASFMIPVRAVWVMQGVMLQGGARCSSAPSHGPMRHLDHSGAFST